METMMKNKQILMEEIGKYSKKPISREYAAYLSTCHGAYEAICMAMGDDEHRKTVHHTDEKESSAMTHQIAMNWTAGMINADGTKGPHWSIEETGRLYKQYGLECDKVEFWAVMNSLYSDYCDALRESAASTPEIYVRLAKAWIKDQDAVPNKLAAYYTYVVKQ